MRVTNCNSFPLSSVLPCRKLMHEEGIINYKANSIHQKVFKMQSVVSMQTDFDARDNREGRLWGVKIQGLPGILFSGRL